MHVARNYSATMMGDHGDGRGRIVGEHIMETGFYQSIAVEKEGPLCQRQSKYQEIIVENSLHYGKILVLDGVVQLTEKDADSYNEMMAHVAMFSHANPKRVLVIGGGDGYVLQEVLKHPSVSHVDHVDLDEQVIQVCREHFPWSHAWDDPRVTLHIADGAAFVRKSSDGFYDVIIQDSSDPFTWDEGGARVDLPSMILYSSDHFDDVYRILSEDGVFNFQAETFHIPSDMKGIADWRKQAIDIGFVDAKYGSLMISSYPKGQIGFMLCSKEDHLPSMEEVESRFDIMEGNGDGTTYYQPKLQRSSFDLPRWVERTVYSAA